ncbi:selenide, water dikinase SelD [Aquabacter spiritensis]|uniref:Selenide, water dikinase n=1 Tax=Aquabacter spiritensis TaxID=933073 RepID=A0A4R3LQC3_9HYPH|nr:selenide, water dikinase SelD [Aquabacter spiritensis]TCT02693.1 selenophosphate synthase [Aquabacter spiritensis]
MTEPAFRLTSLAHGGGCGCKLAPAVLQDLLAGAPAAAAFERLLVGTETGDDAAVWELEDGTCLVATTDFFMPVVDDPDHFGRIAATNAISDIYAMGGTPVLALAILGMPIGKLDASVVRAILGGGRAVCAAAGIPVAGGHSIDSMEPIYGLAVIGTVKKDAIRRNSDARPGDVLILTKALGVGIYSAAFKKEALSQDAYDEMIASTTLLNKVGAGLAQEPDVHAMTDVTGFGLLGHALEMARGSRLSVTIEAPRVPLLSHAEALVRQGFATGASLRNWDSYGADIRLPRDSEIWRRHLWTDPQTSGGLLVSCAPEAADRLLADIVAAGYPSARRIGHVGAGASVVTVEDSHVA